MNLHWQWDSTPGSRDCLGWPGRVDHVPSHCLHCSTPSRRWGWSWRSQDSWSHHWLAEILLISVTIIITALWGKHSNNQILLRWPVIWFGQWLYSKNWQLQKYLESLPWSGDGEHDHCWSPLTCWRMTRMRPGEQWTCGQYPGAGWDSWSWSGPAPPHCCCSLPPSADPQTCSPEHKISAEIFYSLIHYLLPITRLRGRYAPLS